MTETDEKPILTTDQKIEIVIVEILKRGTIERVESILRQTTPLPDDEIESLVEMAQMRLVSSAPTEIRSSMTTVISFHRWNDIYQNSTNPTDRMMAQKQIDKLMGSLH